MLKNVSRFKPKLNLKFYGNPITTITQQCASLLLLLVIIIIDSIINGGGGDIGI